MIVGIWLDLVLDTVQVDVVNFSRLLVFDLNLIIFVQIFIIFIWIKVIDVLKFLFVQSIWTSSLLVCLFNLLLVLKVSQLLFRGVWMIRLVSEVCITLKLLDVLPQQLLELFWVDLDWLALFDTCLPANSLPRIYLVGRVEGKVSIK